MSIRWISNWHQCLGVSLYTLEAGPRHNEPQQLVLLQHNKHILSLPEVGKAEQKDKDLESAIMKGALKAELYWGVQAAEVTSAAFWQTYTLARSSLQFANVHQPPAPKYSKVLKLLQFSYAQTVSSVSPKCRHASCYSQTAQFFSFPKQRIGTFCYQSLPLKIQATAGIAYRHFLSLFCSTRCLERTLV